MKSISILQIGDVHYPENVGKALADIKDPSIPSITNQAAPIPLQVVFRSLAHAIEKSKPSAVLVCGDLTSWGQISDYNACVNYLIDNLSLRTMGNSAIHIVPGNHDVNRTLCTGQEKINTQKFDPLLKAWDSFTPSVITTEGVRNEAVTANGCNLQIFSMNSCMGCGEWHLLPEQLRELLNNLPPALLEKLKEQIEESRKRDPKKAFNLEGDRIDTPMFKHEDIAELNQHLHDAPLASLPIILAHHNLLPQELARIELYTELINSGAFRSSVASIGRPIVYCHGHIHADPVEIVTDATNPGSQLICISAPEVKDGFNELAIHFSNDGKPLGLEIMMHRMRSGGTISIQDKHRVHFTNRKGFLTEEMEQIQICLKKEPEKFANVKKRFDDLTKTKVQKPTFARLIQEATWFGIAKIENEQPDPKYWQIRRGFA